MSTECTVHLLLFSDDIADGEVQAHVVCRDAEARAEYPIAGGGRAAQLSRILPDHLREMAEWRVGRVILR